jgi:hypothetical protein
VQASTAAVIACSMFNASLNIGMTSETDGVRMVEFWTANDTEQRLLRLHCRAVRFVEQKRSPESCAFVKPLSVAR